MDHSAAFSPADDRHAVHVERLLPDGPQHQGHPLPASTRGAGSDYVSPTIVNNVLDCLARGTGCGSFKPAKTYPGLRGAMTWSTNWDALAGNVWSSAAGPKIHGLP